MIISGEITDLRGSFWAKSQKSVRDVPRGQLPSLPIDDDDDHAVSEFENNDYDDDNAKYEGNGEKRRTITTQTMSRYHRHATRIPRTRRRQLPSFFYTAGEFAAPVAIVVVIAGCLRHCLLEWERGGGSGYRIVDDATGNVHRRRRPSGLSLRRQCSGGFEGRRGER